MENVGVGKEMGEVQNQSNTGHWKEKQSCNTATFQYWRLTLFAGSPASLCGSH